MADASSFMLGMEWGRTSQCARGNEEIVNMPELPLEDVERILFASGESIQETNEEKGQNQRKYEETDRVSSFGYWNTYLNYDAVKVENVHHSIENEVIDGPSHLQHGVLNINIKKYIDSEHVGHLNIGERSTYGADFETAKKQKNISSSSSGALKTNFREASLSQEPTHFTTTSTQVLIQRHNPEDYKCNVCTKPALKYSSYGGQVCSSCRSSFRRSAQTSSHSAYICPG